MHHLIICLGSLKPRITVLSYITPSVFFKVVFYFQLFRGKRLTNHIARLVCLCCNGYFVFSENPFWLVFCWLYSLIYSPNASVPLDIKGKCSLLDIKQQRLHIVPLIIPCSYRWYAHFDSRKHISPPNTYKSLHTQMPLQSFKTTRYFGNTPTWQDSGVWLTDSNNWLQPWKNTVESLNVKAWQIIGN